MGSHSSFNFACIRPGDRRYGGTHPLHEIEHVDVLRQDYMRTARAKGFKENRVVYKHGLRNGLLPVITIFGLMIPSFIGGAVVTEQIFSWPGLGKLFVDSAFQRDYPVIMAMTVISATLVVIGNLVADILYAMVDPRIEY